MAKYFSSLGFLLLILALALSSSVPVAAEEAQPAATSEADNLRNLIEQKSVELLQIQAEREKLEKSIAETAQSKNSLTKELKVIDHNINQLNLSIKANKLTLEKLELEITSLGKNILSIERGVDAKKSTIGKLFVELQQKDRENVLVLFLRNKSLAEGVAEAQSIFSINHDLEQGVAELRNLQVELSGRLAEEKNKKRSRQIETTNLSNRQEIVLDQKKEKQQVLTQTKNQETVYQRELEQLIKRQLEISEEVEEIEKELRTKIDPNLLPIPRPGVLGAPVAGNISQEYGFTKFAKNGYRGKFHNGLDIAASIGTAVLAAESGIVYYVGDQDKYCPRGAYGKFVVIDHDNKLTTLYAHLSKMAVTKGARVEKGDLIGYVGKTGYATGSHLHLTVYASPTFYMGGSRTCGPMPFGGDLDPIKYLDI